MSVQMTCCNPCFRKRPISSAAPSGDLLRPALRWRSRPSRQVGAENQALAAELRQPRGQAVGFAHGDAAADGASGSRRRRRSQQRRAAFDAAAVLDFEPCACGDAFEHFQVGRTLRPGAVQIDHVQPPQPRRFEAQGRCRAGRGRRSCGGRSRPVRVARRRRLSDPSRE